MLIEILILFFIVLLISQLYLFIIDKSKSKQENIVEGYTDYEQTTYMLSQKNAINIEDLKKK